MGIESIGSVTSLSAWRALKGDTSIESNYAQRQLFAELYMGATSSVDKPVGGSDTDASRDSDKLRARAQRLHLIGVPLPERIIQPEVGLGDAVAEVVQVNFGGHDEF